MYEPIFFSHVQNAMSKDEMEMRNDTGCRASDNARCLSLVVNLSSRKSHEVTSRMLVECSKARWRLVTLGISNDSIQKKALKCFMCSSPAAC
jgi:hypothetical protein